MNDRPNNTVEYMRKNTPRSMRASPFTVLVDTDDLLIVVDGEEIQIAWKQDGHN